MSSDDTWINPLIRYRIHQESLNEEIEGQQDIGVGSFEDVDENFGARLRRTIIYCKDLKHRPLPETTRATAAVPAPDDSPLPKPPKLLKLRVYWDRSVERRSRRLLRALAL
ncbi:hypothetical protein N7535_000052 [Penicillium sp. DV-2018c]|nr:hypothetical protein N7461_006700 [Penicillium sp. DV-2018c]KAJ5581432.1 hypothetical protein N7535_000052 [Penicillium sp. DV-2018c]